MVKKYKNIKINENNINNYQKLYEIFKNKSEEIFKKLAVIFASLMSISLFITPLNIAVLFSFIVVFFKYMDLVFFDIGYLTKKCNKDIKRILCMNPDLDLDICYNELEYAIKKYNEKLNNNKNEKIEICNNEEINHSNNDEKIISNQYYFNDTKYDIEKVKTLGTKERWKR